MKTLEQIRAELEAQYPVLYRGTASGPVPMSDEDRDSTLDARAQAAFDQQNLLARKIWPTKAEFWNEFSPAEQLAIMDSAEPAIRLLDRQLLVWPGEVWSDDARVTGGLDALVSAGILTTERKAEILAKP